MTPLRASRMGKDLPVRKTASGKWRNRGAYVRGSFLKFSVKKRWVLMNSCATLVSIGRAVNLGKSKEELMKNPRKSFKLTQMESMTLFKVFLCQVYLVRKQLQIYSHLNSLHLELARKVLSLGRLQIVSSHLEWSRCTWLGIGALTCSAKHCEKSTQTWRL